MSQFTPEDISNNYKILREKFGYSKSKYRSPGFCDSCRPCHIGNGPHVLDTSQGHEEKHCRNPPFCWYHDKPGHYETGKCRTWCFYCCRYGHTMRFCRKIKKCVLCGKAGHNPLNCWEYCTMRAWMARTRELERCAECLTRFTEKNHCEHCGTVRVYWWPHWRPSKESQTETNTYIDQESQTELQQAQTTIDNQELRIQELNNNILVLEDELLNYYSVNNNLKSQLLSATQEKEQALADIRKKDWQLEQCKQTDAQPLNVTPATSTRPKDTTRAGDLRGGMCEAVVLNTLCPPYTEGMASSGSEHDSELSQIKLTLIDLQEQQKKISMIVGHLFNENRIQTQHTFNHFNDYPNFNLNPYMGIFDTGQIFTKPQQV